MITLWFPSFVVFLVMDATILCHAFTILSSFPSIGIFSPSALELAF